MLKKVKTSWHLFLVTLLCGYCLAACSKNKEFDVTVDGRRYPTRMKEANVYLSDIFREGYSSQVVLNFPTPRKGDVMGGYGTGLMVRLDASNIEAGDEFFIGIYEKEGEVLNAVDDAIAKVQKPSSLDPNVPLDWRASPEGAESSNIEPDSGSSWRPRSIEADLEANAIGSSTRSTFSTRKPGGGIHMVFEEFDAEIGGAVKGKIIEATLIGHTVDLQTEQSSSPMKIMKLKNFSFDTTFQVHHPTFGQ